MPLLVGLDLGTTSSKAVVLGADGRELSSGRAPTAWETTPSGTEIEAAALLRGALTAVRDALARAPRDEVLGLGVASMAECGVLLDRAGAVLWPVIAWHDRRDLAEVAVPGRGRRRPGGDADAGQSRLAGGPGAGSAAGAGSARRDDRGRERARQADRGGRLAPQPGVRSGQGAVLRPAAPADGRGSWRPGGGAHGGGGRGRTPRFPGSPSDRVSVSDRPGPSRARFPRSNVPGPSGTRLPLSQVVQA